MTVAEFAADDLLLAPADGGSISVKSDDGSVCWVKAAGLRLSELAEDHGYLGFSTGNLIRAARDPQVCASDATQQSLLKTPEIAVEKKRGMIPSLETPMSAVLGKLMLHTHPVYANALSCMEDGKTALAEFGHLHWVDYQPPGFTLAAALDRHESVSAARERTLCFVLQNHGLVCSGPDAARVIRGTKEAVNAAVKFFGKIDTEFLQLAPLPAKAFMWADSLHGYLKQRFRDWKGNVLVSRHRALQAAAQGEIPWQETGALSPDDVFYGISKVIWADAARPAQEWAERYLTSKPGKMVIAIRGEAVALLAENDRILARMEEVLVAHLLIRSLIARRGRPRLLPLKEVSRLQEMVSAGAAVF